MENSTTSSNFVLFFPRSYLRSLNPSGRSKTRDPDSSPADRSKLLAHSVTAAFDVMFKPMVVPRTKVALHNPVILGDGLVLCEAHLSPNPPRTLKTSYSNLKTCSFDRLARRHFVAVSSAISISYSELTHLARWPPT